MLPIITLLLAHTPQDFYDTCPTDTIALEDIDVSSVTYMKTWPYCNYSFEVQGSDCNFNVLTLHRFHTAKKSAFIQIENGTTYFENKEDKNGEPFTLTPVVTTIELGTIQTCKFVIGDVQSSIVTLVMGKKEDWWLFATIPYYASRIQWQWAYRQWDFWFWPPTVLAGLIITWPKRPAILHTLAIFTWTVVTDLLAPLIELLTKVHWPTGGLFNGLIAAKVGFIAIHAYVMWKFEPARRGKNGPYFNTLRITPILAMIFAIFWLSNIALGIGFYILQPVMLKRYTSRMSIHTSKQGYKVVPTTT